MFRHPVSRISSEGKQTRKKPSETKQSRRRFAPREVVRREPYAETRLPGAAAKQMPSSRTPHRLKRRVFNTMKRVKTSLRDSIFAALTATSLLLTLFGGGRLASAQTTFVGDFDTSFAAPKGYYVDPQLPDPAFNDQQQTTFVTGESLPDGSIIAGGRHLDSADPKGDFYVRKFTASGAVDTSFGTNGFVRTNIANRFDGVPSLELPRVLKVQPDGKIVFAGECRGINGHTTTTPDFGNDVCVVRYNANGTLDQTFGGFAALTTGQGTTVHSIPIEPGKLVLQTGLIANGQLFGTSGIFHDMAIQPDGKIVLVGETRNFESFFGAQQLTAIVVRLNANGSLDATFGTGGIARWIAPQNGTCRPERRFLGVRLQTDGRIIAVGHDGSASGESCFLGRFFAVTRWTATGQLETVRRLDNNADVGQDERAVSVHFSRDASKILVSGSYRNLSGTPAGRNKPTIIRLNIRDLSLDTTFGSGGIVQTQSVSNSFVGSTFDIKAIQQDGKILGIDDVKSTPRLTRYNPDGSPDSAFGNEATEFGFPGNGSLNLSVVHFNNVTDRLRPLQVLVRPNGKINLIGFSFAFNPARAVVSQNTSTGAQNPIDDPQTFAFVHYYDFLNREADSAGLAFWTGNITSCGSNAECVRAKRVNVSAAFFLSIEFQETGFLVYRFYKSAFGDMPGKPLPLRRNEFLPDTQKIGEGVIVNQGDWEQKLEQNKQAFAAEFVARPRFVAAYPSNMTATEFVDKLNQNAGGVLDATERSQLITELGATPADAQKRASVLRKVAEDQTLRDAEFRKAFVLMQYFGYLQRNPDDAPDTNFDGYNFWLSKLNQFGGDFARAEMVRAFIESGEYRGRFGTP